MRITLAFCLLFLCTSAFASRIYLSESPCDEDEDDYDVIVSEQNGSNTKTKTFGCHEARLELGSYGSKFRIKSAKTLTITKIKSGSKESGCLKYSFGDNLVPHGSCSDDLCIISDKGAKAISVAQNTAYDINWSGCNFKIKSA
mmetsp:Transcript_75466/g.113717  ORF Transcript_75466/g.113717 Transcript_75466/m.113717 type:complete len:143 (-) Transcript_75466:41-469(-)